jgi:hypothetical protein
LDKDLTINDILGYKARDLRCKLGLDLPHPTSQGDLGENAWISFMQSFLPSRYAVSKGFVFDSKGGISEQIDVIIYDPHHSPLIYDTPNGERYVTAESVYAVFEVKPVADKENLEYAQDKIESVRNLCRTSRPMISHGKQVPARELTRIIGGLLATNAITPEILKSHLEALGKVDLICAANAATLYKRPNGEIEVSNRDEAVSSFFYLLLDELFKLGTVPAIDIREYAKVALKSFRLEGDISVD